MLKVIVNSTPIIVLCRIGKLDILCELYGEVTIPTAVFQKVMAMEDSACMQVRNAGSWNHVESIRDETSREKYLEVFSYVCESVGSNFPRFCAIDIAILRKKR